ncbi:reverse transcriptase domain-containing protein [Tanacetum coccineum]
MPTIEPCSDVTSSSRGYGVTSTFRHPEVPNTLIKLLLFPFSLDGEVRDWLDKEPPRSILTWDDLVSKFINQFFPPSKTTYLRNKITTFYQEPNETFNKAWERFKELLRQCPHHGYSELHQLDTFYNSLYHDKMHIDSSRVAIFLDNMPAVSTNAHLSTSTPSNSFEFQQLAASLEDKIDIRMSRLEKMISEKNVTTPATVKAVEEVCVTCGSNHNFSNCPLTRNEFPVFHDNINQFQQTAAVGNFVQRNPPNLSNQMRPPGFNVQSNQGNQSRYQGNNSNQNPGNNFTQHHQNNQGQVFQPPTNQPPVYQVPPYQAPTPQIQGVSKMDFENYVKANDAFEGEYSASTSNSGTLPSQTVTNPRQQINDITTRSGKTLEGPLTPLVPTPVVSIPLKEPEQNPETSTEKVQNPNLENTAQVPPPEEEDSTFIEIPKPKAKKTVNVKIQDPNSPKPMSYQSKLPYPERMKVREYDKPIHQWLSIVLRTKEKLEEIAITTVNVECSAIIMNKVPEKLEDLGKFLIPCALQELNRTSALADSGASINLLPYSIYKKLGLEVLTPTRMTLELANRSITHSMGIAEDVVVRVDGFSFLTDFVVVNFEPDPRVPIILGRPFLRTAKALIDLYEETLTLRHFVHAISVIDFSKDDPFSGSTTTQSDDPSPSSSPIKTSDNFEKFADELAPLDSLPPGNDDSTLKKDLHEENFQVYSNPLFEFDDNFKSSTINPLFDEMKEDVEIKNSNVSDEPVLLNTPLSDKVECFAPEDYIDEIDAFLAMEVSSNVEEGYFDSEGDVTFLDNLLSDDDSHNLAAEEISDHEPEQNESSITLSPRSDPLHHKFVGELLTLPSGNDHEFEEYLSLMTVLCDISTSQSQENIHANQSSVIEYDLIPQGVENDDSEDEDHELPNLDHQDDPSIPSPPPEPPDVEKCFEPEAGISITKVFKGVFKSHDFMADILPTHTTLVLDLTFILFLSSFLSFGSEDTVFDPGIITFPFSYLDPVAFSMEVSCVALLKDN